MHSTFQLLQDDPYLQPFQVKCTLSRITMKRLGKESIKEFQVFNMKEDSLGFQIAIKKWEFIKKGITLFIGNGLLRPRESRFLVNLITGKEESTYAKR